MSRDCFDAKTGIIYAPNPHYASMVKVDNLAEQYGLDSDVTWIYRSEKFDLHKDNLQIYYSDQEWKIWKSTYRLPIQVDNIPEPILDWMLMSYLATTLRVRDLIDDRAIHGDCSIPYDGESLKYEDRLLRKLGYEIRRVNGIYPNKLFRHGQLVWEYGNRRLNHPDVTVAQSDDMCRDLLEMRNEEA